MESINLRRYEGKEKMTSSTILEHFFFTPGGSLTAEKIRRYLDEKNSYYLNNNLFSLGCGCINDGTNTSIKNFESKMKIFHSSSNEQKLDDTHTIFYGLVASKKNPASITREEPVECEWLERVNKSPFKIRFDGEPKDVENGKFSHNNTTYYVFAVLVGIGHHIADKSYKIDLGNFDYLPEKIDLK